MKWHFSILHPVAQNVQSFIFFLLTTKLVSLLLSHTHILSPFLELMTAGISQGVFMTLTLIIIVDAEIKKNNRRTDYLYKQRRSLVQKGSISDAVDSSGNE